MKCLVALVLGVALLAFTGNVLAEEKAYVPKDNEELYGTWVNTEYRGSLPQKYVYRSDGTFGSSYKAEWEPGSYHPYDIKEKWTDSEGNVWYKYCMKWVTGGKLYVLCKLSNSGNTYEIVYDPNGYPTEFDKNKYPYVIRYRQ